MIRVNQHYSLLWILVLLFTIVLCNYSVNCQQQGKQKFLIDDLTDIFRLKDVLRENVNCLVLFHDGNYTKETQRVIQIFKQTSDERRALSCMMILNCGSREQDRLCKALKVYPQPYELKNYRQGKFHRDYKRQITVSALTTFLKDPTGDIPWHEDPRSVDVHHFISFNTFQKFMDRRVRLPIFVFFYTPWCVDCRRLQPEFAKIATEIKKIHPEKYMFAGMDVEIHENVLMRTDYNLVQFPSFVYFVDEETYFYQGDIEKDDILTFLMDPVNKNEKKLKPIPWSLDTTSKIAHVTHYNFASIIAEKSVLLMFYAPWCKYSQMLRKQYEKAARIMKQKGIPGLLAAVDCAEQPEFLERYKIPGYPTLKYFRNSRYKFDVPLRDGERIAEYMRAPYEIISNRPEYNDEQWQRSDSAVIHLDAKNFEKTLKRVKHALVFFDWKNNTFGRVIRPNFTEAAEAFRDNPEVAFVGFNCFENYEVCRKYGVPHYPYFVYFQHLDKVQHEYVRKRHIKELIKFMKDPETIIEEDRENSKNKRVEL